MSSFNFGFQSPGVSQVQVAFKIYSHQTWVATNIVMWRLSASTEVLVCISRFLWQKHLILTFRDKNGTFWNFVTKIVNKQARKPRSYASPKLWPTHLLTYSLTGVKCRATSVAKNIDINIIKGNHKNIDWEIDFWVIKPVYVYRSI